MSTTTVKMKVKSPRVSMEYSGGLDDAINSLFTAATDGAHRVEILARLVETNNRITEWENAQ